MGALEQAWERWSRGAALRGASLTHMHMEAAKQPQDSKQQQHGRARYLWVRPFILFVAEAAAE
jgi:hypothetical protein